MSVIAKFRFYSKTLTQGSISHVDENGKQSWASGETAALKLMPVTGDKPDNASWHAATPGGTLELLGVRQEVADQFELGEEYYVLITPVKLGQPVAVVPGQR